MSFVHRLYRSDPDYVACDAQPPWTGVEEWSRVTCPDCLTHAPLRVRAQLAKAKGVPNHGPSVAEILAMSRRNRTQQGTVDVLVRELYEARTEINQLREKLRGIHLIRQTAARFGMKQEALVAAFLDWIAAGNPLTRRPFVPKEGPMLLDALRTLAQMGVLSHPDQFPRVAVLSAPAAGESLPAYLHAIHVLHVLASQGGSSAIRDDAGLTGGPAYFRLWPTGPEHEADLRAVITPDHPPHRDRYGVPILCGSMIRVAPAPGRDRTLLHWIRTNPGEETQLPLGVSGVERLLVLETRACQPRSGCPALIVLGMDTPKRPCRALDWENLVRVSVVGSSGGMLAREPLPADSVPGGL